MITLATMTRDSLALATLGDATRKRNNPICEASPKVAKASTVLCRYHWHYRKYFANGNTALKVREKAVE
jgi:hypothetical protein